jgi:hypothetical protein
VTSKVYLVTRGEYSSYMILAAFTTEKAADRLASVELADVEEYELDPEYTFPPGKQLYCVTMLKDGTVVEVSQEYASSGYHTACPVIHRDKAWIFTTWAENEEQAVKVANERRTVVLATGIPWNLSWGDFLKLGSLHPDILKWVPGRELS